MTRKAIIEICSSLYRAAIVLDRSDSKLGEQSPDSRLCGPRCDDISNSFCRRASQGVLGRRTEAVVEVARGKGRIDFEWTQYSMFYRRSTLALNASVDCLCTSRVASLRLDPSSRNKGVGGVTSREGRRIYRELPFSPSLSHCRVDPLLIVTRNSTHTSGIPYHSWYLYAPLIFRSLFSVRGHSNCFPRCFFRVCQNCPIRNVLIIVLICSD